MKVSDIRVRDIEDRWESLSLCLQAVARWAGVELHIRTINAALGLSFMISAPREGGTTDPAWWMTLGRDAFLVPAGRAFGLTIRPLLGPGSGGPAGDPVAAGERFQEVLRPQIQAALAGNQPVLCWPGWPDYRTFLWGVIVEADDSDLGFRGSTMWAHGRLLPLTCPPTRLYVVEDIAPRQPDSEELLAFAVGNIRRIVRDELAPEFGVVTGLAAYDRWLAWLAEGAPRGGHHAHYQMARFVTCNRESARRFIDHYKDGRHEPLRPILEAMTADCQGTVGALATSRDLKAVEVLFRSPDGRAALAAGVRAARDFLEAQIQTIEHLARDLGCGQPRVA